MISCHGVSPGGFLPPVRLGAKMTAELQGSFRAKGEGSPNDCHSRWPWANEIAKLPFDFPRLSGRRSPQAVILASLWGQQKTDRGTLNCVFLILLRVAEKCRIKAKEWMSMKAQFVIVFEDRLIPQR
jgi:hypothetical protein